MKNTNQLLYHNWLLWLQSLYQVNYVYLQPLVVMSILCGVWGIVMTMKMLTEVLQGFHVQGKFIVLQLVLILAKLQGVWARLFVWFGWMPCKPPITPTVYANREYSVTLQYGVNTTRSTDTPDKMFSIKSTKKLFLSILLFNFYIVVINMFSTQMFSNFADGSQLMLS